MTLTTILGYVLVALFFVIEVRGRVGEAAKSLEKGPADRGSTRAIGVAFFVSGLGLLAAPILDSFQIGSITWILGWIGVILGVWGLGTRLWAMRTLGRFYTRTLQAAENQPILQIGPYRFIRHPGYLGTILILLGAALATANWITLAVVAISTLSAYHYRIRAEETMLMSVDAGEFSRYRAHTWKLIPFIY